MQRKVLWPRDIQISSAALGKMGDFAREGLDTLVKDRIDDDLSYVGFTSVATTTTQVTVGPGRYYKGGQVFFNDDQGGTVIDMLPRLPATNRRIVSLVAWGTTDDTAIEPRTFLVNAANNTVEARPTATESRRRANIGFILGTEAPTPAAPSIPADNVEFARVLLSNTGIIDVTMVEGSRGKSVRENSADIQGLKQFDQQFGRRVETLASDLAALADRYMLVPSPSIMRQVYQDLARLRRLTNAPSTAVAYDEDYFLNRTKSDTTHPSYLARVLEGVRFAHAQERYDIMQLFNPIDSRVKTVNSFMLPAWTHKARMEVSGFDAELALSSFQVQTITQVQRTVSQSAVRTGPEFTICENHAQWAGEGVFGGRAMELLSIQGQTFQVLGETESAWNQYTAEVGLVGHQEVRVQQIWEDTWSETYWDQVVNTETFTGALIAQTFLNAQAGYLTRLGLFFRRVGTTGDVKVSIVEVFNGTPVLQRAIAKVTIPVASLKAMEETLVDFTPTYLDPGKRYGIVVQSAGNHTLAAVNGNKFAQGSLFRSTDDAFVQGDISQDLAFKAYFASFEAARVEVQMTPLQLENGMAGIQLIHADIVPDGTQLIWEIQREGVWYPMSASYPYGGHPLTGLPALVPLRAVFVGTTDLMPGLDMSKTERRTSRPRTDFTHISSVRDNGQTVATAIVEITVDQFDPDFHTISCALLKGAGYATVQTPAAVTTTVDPVRPERRTLRYAFTGVAAQTYKIRLQGTTTAAVRVFHVERRFDHASA